MKQATFITNLAVQEKPHVHPWKEGRYFNNAGITLQPGEGLPLFRRDFALPAGTAKTVLRATALGVFELYLNGRRVGNEEMKPGWTDYFCRVFEFEYDVTAATAEKNVLVAAVSNGWWSGRISFGEYGWLPVSFAAEVECFDKDGKTLALIATDKTWQTAVGGRTLFADIWDGEYIDAAKPCAFTEPDAYAWEPAVLTEYATPPVVPHVGEPIRVREHLNRRPVSAVLWRDVEENGTDFGCIKRLASRVGNGCEGGVLHAGEKLILDLGQDMVGRPRLALRAARGTRVEIFCSEMLNDSGSQERGNDGPEGSLYMANYRTAMARTVYLANGESDEVCEAHFAFFGFRYFEIRTDGDVEILSLTGVCIGSDLKETGMIETDNAEINRFFQNVLWGQRSNYLSIPTDCPQRDERLGWSGDTQAFSATATYNADADGFLRKWLGDMRDGQRLTPGYGNVAPVISKIYTGGVAGWGDAGVIVPHVLYVKYNDVETLREHYDSMEKYMAWLADFGMHGPAELYGDWLCYEDTPKPYISLCYYANNATLMQEYARILGKPDREAHYAALFADIKREFHKLYVTDGKVNIATQSAYLFALHFKLLEEAERPAAVASLKEKIIGNGYSLSTGFLGTSILNQTLSELGLDKLAYSLLLQTGDPSWLYSVRQGATTVWERWNSYTKAKGFGLVRMNSFNHYAYGAVVEWMYDTMAGIRPDPEHPGFTEFILAPHPDLRTPEEIPEGQERIRFVRACYEARTGRIESAWAFENGLFTYRFTIPQGTKARVEFPLCNGRDTLVLNDLSVTAEELGGCVENGRAVFCLGAGTYTLQ